LGRVVTGVALLTALGVGACGAPPGERPPPPRGASYRDYLHSGDGPTPTRPTGTLELDSMRLHVIDVGQGLAALVELPCGAILVDTGGELNAQYDGVASLVRFLDGFFARRRDLDGRIALLVISHPHLDHTRGIAAVLERYRVGNVVDNGDVREAPGGVEQLALHAWLARHPEVGHEDVAADAVPVEGLSSPVIDPIGACEGSALDPTIRVLWGGPLGREEIGHDPNDDSVVVRVDLGEASFLLTGDLERLGIARVLDRFEKTPLLDADVMVVPHHGSKHSTARALDVAVSPEVAIISAGPYARHLGGPEEYTAHVFGHPAKGAIDDLLAPGAVHGRRPHPIRVKAGVRGAWKTTPSEFTDLTIDRAIYATSWDGTVSVRAWANGWLEVATTRAAPRAPVAGGLGAR
jgi:competence protein ComEC